MYFHLFVQNSFSTSQPFFDTFPQSSIHWLKEFLSKNCDQTMQLLECETSCNPFEPKDSWLKQKDVRRFAYDMRYDGCQELFQKVYLAPTNKNF